MGVLSDVKGKASDAIETAKLNSKISSEQNEINAVMRQIGEFYYNKYLESKTSDEGIAGFCKTIDGHNAVIAEAKAEIERIKAKSAAPAVTPAAPAAAASGGTVCPACGAKFADGKKFCTECGAQTVVPAPAPAEADGVVCSACGKKNPAGQKFCNECGGKLGSEKRICACGAEVAPGKKFCGECGAKFN
jgi:hypothetical protein